MKAKNLWESWAERKNPRRFVVFCHFFNHVVKIISVLIWVDKHKFLTFSTRKQLRSGKALAPLPNGSLFKSCQGHDL